MLLGRELEVQFAEGDRKSKSLIIKENRKLELGLFYCKLLKFVMITCEKQYLTNIKLHWVSFCYQPNDAQTFFSNSPNYQVYQNLLVINNPICSKTRQ